VFPAGGIAPPIGSTLEVQPSGGLAAGPSLGLVLKQAAGRLRAEEELAALRTRLFGQSDLVTVCDLICGQELTPREPAAASVTRPHRGGAEGGAGHHGHGEGGPARTERVVLGGAAKCTYHDCSFLLDMLATILRMSRVHCANGTK